MTPEPEVGGSGERREAWPLSSKSKAENNQASECVIETVSDGAVGKGGGPLCLGGSEKTLEES